MENIRVRTEEIERKTLSPYASLSSATKGRRVYEVPCDIRTDYQRDRDRIIHCKAFRRLKHKTQVFLAPESDHYRTRLTHTLEVAQIARTVARALRLNEDLTEAIALGHDLGHTPFGHAGERALDKLCPEGFRHYEQSGRVCEFLEKDFKGLNLTAEVIDGIVRHTKGELPSTLEGQIVRVADKIAYINHDIDDAVRAGIIREDDIPKDVTDYLGRSKSRRIDTMVRSLIENSTDVIKFDDECGEYFERLHGFLYENVYLNPAAKSEEAKVDGIIEGLFMYIAKHRDRLPKEYEPDVERDGFLTAVTDYIAGMTDHYAITVYTSFFIPKSWQLGI